MKIVLASASPRRRELLHMIFEEFDVMTADGEEAAELQTPSGYVETLAKQKADQVMAAHRLAPDQPCLLVSADTIVYQNGRVLGKPKSSGEAEQMLSSLAGNAHEVYTGMCLTCLEDSQVVRQMTFSERTRVFVMPLTAEEIDAYIKTGEPFDKAGGYGIQGVFGKYIEGIEGDYYNVVGLPVNRLYKEMKKLGVLERGEG